MSDGEVAVPELSKPEGAEHYAVRVERVPDSSHWIIHEHPALSNHAIREFIAR